MKFYLTLLITLVASTVTGQQVARKLILQKGQQFEKTSNLRMNMKLTLMGQEREMNMTNMLISLITIKEVTDTAYVITHTLTRRTLSSDATGDHQTYDSDSIKDAENGVIEKALMDGIGKTAEVIVSKDGIIISSHDTLNAAHAALVGTNMGRLANAAKQPGNPYELVAILPTKPIKKGAQWADSAIIEGNKGLVNYTLAALDKKEATVSHTAKVSGENEMDRGGVKIIMKIEGNTTGIFTFDPQTGLMRGLTQNMDSKGTMEVMGQTAPFTYRMETVTVIKPKKS